ncbi:hypothetical protein AgCh_019658 [Apium graveolens]
MVFQASGGWRSCGYKHHKVGGSPPPSSANDNPKSPRGLLLAGPGLKLLLDGDGGGVRCSCRVGTYKTEPEGGGVPAAPPAASGCLRCVRVLSDPDRRSILDPGYLDGGDVATCPSLLKVKAECVRVLSDPDRRNVLDPGYLDGGDVATCPRLLKEISDFSSPVKTISLYAAAAGYDNEESMMIHATTVPMVKFQNFGDNGGYGYCMGLLYFAEHYTGRIVVSNPVRSQFTILPPVPVQMDYCWFSYWTAIGLGFDSSTKTFKMVLDCNSVFVHGFLHWMIDPSDSEIKNERARILAFDVSKETFKVVPHPELRFNEHSDTYFRILDIEGNLGMLDLSPRTKFDIWVMDYEKKSWNKEFTIDITIVGDIYVDSTRVVVGRAFSLQRSLISIPGATKVSRLDCPGRDGDKGWHAGVPATPKPGRHNLSVDEDIVNLDSDDNMNNVGGDNIGVDNVSGHTVDNVGGDNVDFDKVGGDNVGGHNVDDNVGGDNVGGHNVDDNVGGDNFDGENVDDVKDEKNVEKKIVISGIYRVIIFAII